jgi:SNF2 family DNA or RNA helicase
MVGNVKVISKGFNLQNGYSLFFYSNTFSLEDRLQSEARIKRIGQNKACLYFDYISEDTVDMKVVAALRQHREVADYIRNTPMKSFLTTWDGVFEQEYANIYGSQVELPDTIEQEDAKEYEWSFDEPPF